jgi:uncharacterized protein (DUF2236 family)
MANRLLSLALRPIAAPLLTFEGCNFAGPPGEPAIVPADSMSWRVFSNPLSVYIGGVAAVLLELAEPRVRSGVWDHSSFRQDPGERMRRTGAAAMVTVYAARSEFEALAARVNAIHARIAGVTPAGEPYRADDPELLLWVQATASFAFLSAYESYVRPVSADERDLFYEEARCGAPLYGVTDAPGSEAELKQLFGAMEPRLERSALIDEFLHIMRSAPVLPLPLRPLQRLVVRAAVELVPADLRDRLGLDAGGGLTRPEKALVRLLATTAGKVHVPTSPWAQASKRLGLSADYLDRSH